MNPRFMMHTIKSKTDKFKEKREVRGLAASLLENQLLVGQTYCGLRTQQAVAIQHIHSTVAVVAMIN